MEDAQLFHSKLLAANDHVQISAAELLECLAIQYCTNKGVNIVDPGEALSYILELELYNDKLKRRVIKEFEHVKMFQKGTLNFKSNIEISSLDVPLIVKLLRKMKGFITYENKTQTPCDTKMQASTSQRRLFCCDNCLHNCQSCGDEECKQSCQNNSLNLWDHICQGCHSSKLKCIEANCSKCEKGATRLQCGIHNVREGLNTLKDNRNVAFHLTISECKDFIDGKMMLQNFPHCNKEKELFKLARRSFTSIVNFLANRDYFKERALTFKERRKRVVDIKTLFSKEGEYSQDLAKNLSRQCLFLTEHNCQLQEEVTRLKDEKEYNEIKLTLQKYFDGGCELLLKKTVVTILEVKIHKNLYEGTRKLIEIDGDSACNSVQEASFIKLYHKFEDHCKYDYEVIIEDDQQHKWKCVCSNLDPLDDNLLVVTNGNSIKLSPNAREVVKHLMQLEENRPCGLSATFLCEENVATKIVEFKDFQCNQWKKLNQYKVIHLEENKYRFECTSLAAGDYDFRILMKSDNYHLLEMNGIKVLDENAFQHVASCHKSLLFLHPIGGENNAFETLSNPSTCEAKGKRVSIKLPGGSIATKDIDALGSYIDQNFLNQRYICFPPFYVSSDYLHLELAKRLDKYFQSLDTKMFVMLPKVDFEANLRTLGYTKDNIAQLFSNELRGDLENINNIVIFDIVDNIALILTMCNDTNTEMLRLAHIQADKSVKAFLTITEKLLNHTFLAVVSVLACQESSRAELQEIHHCKDCSQLTLTKDDMQSPALLEEWFNRLNNKVKKEFKIHLGFDPEEAMEKSSIQFPDRIMQLMSINDYNVPATCVGSDEEKISRLVLTAEQITAAYDDRQKKKVIKGNYGCGKTLVLKKTLGRLMNNPVSDAIYYVNWDPYSLINVEIFKLASSMQHDRKVYCKNICQLSEEEGSLTIFSLSKCLQHIADLHANGRAHVLIDEYDEEDLNKCEVSKIRKVLQTSPAFKESTIVVSVQSVEKQRKSYLSKNSEPLESDKSNWEECGMQVYTLPHTMRFTNNIHNFVAEVQKFVTHKPNTYYAARRDSLPMENPTEEIISEAASQDIPDNTTNSNTGDEKRQESNQPIIRLQPEPCIDTLAKQIGGDIPEDENSSRLETTFKYTPCESGHKILGEIPMLLRLDVIRDKSVKVVMHFIKNFCFNGETKALLLCNDLPLMTAFEKVFKAFDKMKVISYFEHLMEALPPSFERQTNVYDQLISQEGERLLLLADNRGVRGLEYSNVIAIINERDDFERHFLVESLCRATSKLCLISFQDTTCKTNLSAIVDSLLEKGYVKDMTSQCVERSEGSEDESFEYFRKLGHNKLHDKRIVLTEKLEKIFSTVFSQQDVSMNKQKWSDLENLLKTEQFQKFQEVIEMNPDLTNLHGGDYNENLLHLASLEANVDCVQVLIRNGCGLKERNLHGRMPIHLAAMFNRTDIIKVFIENDETLINEVDSYNQTSLHHAAHRNHKDLVELLLKQQNLNVNAKDRRGLMADEMPGVSEEIMTRTRRRRDGLDTQDVNTSTKKRDWTFYELEHLLKREQFKTFQEVIEMNPDLTKQLGGEYAENLLHLTSFKADVDCVQVLIRNGCSLKERNSLGRMPIHLAAMFDRKDIIKVFIENDESLINEMDGHNQTSLHHAAQRNHKDLVELLLKQQNVNVNAKDRRGLMADEKAGVSEEIKSMITRLRNETYSKV